MRSEESTLEPPENLAAITVRASAYSIAASATTLILGLSRSVVMARLLMPTDFGTAALALALVELVTPLRDFGLDHALIHRVGREEVQEDVLAVHFTLRLILGGLFALLFVGCAPLLRLIYPQRTTLPLVLLAVASGEAVRALGATPSTHLRMNMQFRELAIVQVLTSLTMTLAGPMTAWAGWGVWAIVVERASGVVVGTVTAWLLMRSWRPRLKLDAPLARWYLDYGKFVFLSSVLSPIMEQFDDLWVGMTLGSHPLGIYSKAYEFAQYPRRLVSDPLAQVLWPVYSKAQDDYRRLSRVFFRSASLVLRAGFLFAGGLVLIAREFTHLFLGLKWSPMILTFQIMVVYTALYPLLALTGYLAAACGHPQINARFRIVQAAVFVPGVIVASRVWGTNGVAVVADVVLVIGLVISLRRVSRLVSLSVWRLFSAPTVAVLASAALCWRLSALFGGTEISRMLLKGTVFSISFTLFLLALEWKEYPAQLKFIADLVSRRNPSDM